MLEKGAKFFDLIAGFFEDLHQSDSKDLCE